MPQSSIWLIGNWQNDDFAAPLRWLHEQAQCHRFDTSAAAVSASLKPPHSSHHAPRDDIPAAIIFAQSRPGEISTADVERLHAAAPLARLFALTGPWCEGELRSGRPLAGVTRIPWRRWQACLETEFGHSTPGHPRSGSAPRDAPFGSEPEQPRTRLALPRTATDGERIEHSVGRLAATHRSPAKAIVCTSNRFTYELLADALGRLNVATSWHFAGSNSLPEAADLTIYDGWQQVPIRSETEPVANAAPPRLLLLHFPRPDEAALAATAGIGAVIAMPFLLADLAAPLDRILAAKVFAKI